MSNATFEQQLRDLQDELGVEHRHILVLLVLCISFACCCCCLFAYTCCIVHRSNTATVRGGLQPEDVQRVQRKIQGKRKGDSSSQTLLRV